MTIWNSVQYYLSVYEYVHVVHVNGHDLLEVAMCLTAWQHMHYLTNWHTIAASTHKQQDQNKKVLTTMAMGLLQRAHGCHLVAWQRLPGLISWQGSLLLLLLLLHGWYKLRCSWWQAAHALSLWVSLQVHMSSPSTSRLYRAGLGQGRLHDSHCWVSVGRRQADTHARTYCTTSVFW